MKPQTFYHLSPTKGISHLRPSVPRDVDDECDTPRVCVCPSVALAYDASGLEGLNLPDANIHIYMTQQVPDVTPDEAFEHGTLDAPDSREHWYLSETPCVYISTMEQWYTARGIT